MQSRIKLLSLTVGAAVVNLAVGAFLVVLGIFDEHLGWDLFSPEAERALWGLFFTCLALGSFGAVISAVLGIQEAVKSLRRMVDAGHPTEAEPARDVSRRGYAVILAALLILLVATVWIFNAANRRVENRRLETFKLIVRDEMRQLGPHIETEIARIPAPCATCATPALAELQKTLEGLSFCRSAIFYMADPANGSVLWRFPAGATHGEVVFERLFIASDIDRAIHQALSGDTAWIDQMNGDPAFNWHQVIRGSDGKVRAVLKIFGDPGESYRDYQAVAQAAKVRG